MRNGYKIDWTDHAKFELKKTLDFLEDYWTEKEVSNFSKELDKTIKTISYFPETFPKVKERPKSRRAVVDSLNVIYYTLDNKVIYITSLFSTRQKPDKRKFTR